MENAAFVTEPTAEQITPEKLREIADDWSLGPSGKAMREAADRIETLEADIWLLHQEIERLRQPSDTEIHLASTNAKLLAALEPFAEAARLGIIGGRPAFEFCGADDYEKAIAAIAAAKGESK